MSFKDLKISAFIQARISSERLKGKVLLPLCNKSILVHIIERVNLLKKLIDYTVVLVPSEEIQIFKQHLSNFPDVIIFGGSKENVLERFFLANKKIESDVIIRLTGDNPLFDIFHLKKGILKHIKEESDYTIYNKLPLGAGFEILSKRALEICYQNSTKDYQFEHVTPYIRENRDKFKILELNPSKFYQHPEYRLTVDEEPDYKLMQIIYENLYKDKPIKLKDVIKFLQENPSFFEINKNVKQKTI